MVISITLNPAVDMWLSVPELRKGDFSRARTKRLNPGGKGVIIARILHKLNMGPVVASGILAGRTGLTLEDYLSRDRVPANFIFLPGFDTRVNVEIVDESDGSITQVNTEGPSVSQDYIRQLQENVIRISHLGDVVVLAGSLPAGLPHDTYLSMSEVFISKGLRVVVNASSELIKPILDSDLPIGVVVDPKDENGFGIQTMEEEVSLVKKCLRSRPVLSFSWAKTENVIGIAGRVFHARVVNPSIRTLWGANAALCAGLVNGIEEQRDPKDTVVTAMAMAYYMARDPWAVFEKANAADEIQKLKATIEVEEL
ncbi:uridylate kinase [Coprothermobacteraceae bacterium]|nr:uridylate kinase [Coprothermobacteraceae bacterium]